MDTLRAEGGPDQESWSVHYYVTEVPIEGEESRQRLELIADYMARFEQEDSTYIDFRASSDSVQRRVRVFLFDTQGDTSATLTADRVRYFEMRKQFDAQGKVIVITQDEKRLETEHLSWFEEERKVTTPGFVNIVTPSETAQGYGLEADENLETYTIFRFTGEFRVEDSG